MHLLRKPNIILAVKGEMLKRIPFIVLEQALKGKFEAERQCINTWHNKPNQEGWEIKCDVVI